MSEKFSVQAWKDGAKQKVADFKGWLARSQAIPFVTYSTIVGVTVWPLVEAVAKAGAAGQTGLLPTFYLASMGLLANLGTNLLSEQIQSWFDRSQAGDPPTEDEVILWVSNNAASNPELRAELDHLIDEFEVLPQVQATVPQDQMAGFVNQIKAEMEQLGNWNKFAETITNSQIVQGNHNTVAGERAVIVGRDAKGNIVTGDGNHITINHYGKPPDAPAEVQFSTPVAGEPANLRTKMTDWLSQSDLKTICFDLGIDFDNLAGKTFTNRTTALIELMRQQNRIGALVSACESANPYRNWRE